MRQGEHLVTARLDRARLVHGDVSRIGGDHALAPNPELFRKLLIRQRIFRILVRKDGLHLYFYRVRLLLHTDLSLGKTIAVSDELFSAGKSLLHIR